MTKLEQEKIRIALQCENILKSDQPETVWMKLKRNQKRDPDIQEAYASSLINAGFHYTAEKFLRKTIAYHWNTVLVRLYGHALTNDLDYQIYQAKKWQTKHATSSDLMITLVRLYIQNKQRDKARDCLAKILPLIESHNDYLEIGLLMESIGESAKALQSYRSGLQATDFKNYKNQLLKESAAVTGLIPVLDESNISKLKL